MDANKKGKYSNQEFDIINKLLDFNTDPKNAEIRNFYEDANIWKILKIERKEQIHSAFLAWLLGLDVNGDKPFFRLFLNLLMRKIGECCESESNKIEALQKALIGDKLKIQSVDIESEFSINKISKIRCSDRLDIFAKAKVLGIENYSNIEVFIENKVDSKEGSEKSTLSIKNPTKEEEAYKHKKQTERYYYACSFENRLSLKNENKDNECKTNHGSSSEDEDKDYESKTIQLFCFLSPSDKAEDIHFISITYQDLVDYIIEPMKEREELDAFTQQTISDYLKNLCNPNNLTKMASTKKEQQLLKEFFIRNADLFRAALDVMINDDDTTEEEQKEYESICNSMDKSKKSRRFFSINGNNDSLKMYEVLAAFVRYKLRKGATVEEIENEIKTATREPGQNHVSAIQSEVKRGEKSYSFEFDGTKYYVTKEWGLGTEGKNFDGFMKHVNDSYPDFRIELR